MREHERESARDDAFEALLAQSVAELPPEEIVADVTPWRRAMNCILFGMALCAVTLNFWCLNYILPAIGTVLLLLGFRALRQENRWLGGCFAVTVIRAACFFATLILNTTILQSAVFTPAVTTTLTVTNAVLLLALYFCFWRGLLAVQKKAGLPVQAGGALALIVWYALVCVLAAVQYGGWVVPIAMLIGYGFILRSLYRLSGALDEAGYAIAPGPVRVTDRCIALVLAAVLGIGGALGYLLGRRTRPSRRRRRRSGSSCWISAFRRLCSTTSRRRTSPPATARCASWSKRKTIPSTTAETCCGKHTTRNMSAITCRTRSTTSGSCA